MEAAAGSSFDDVKETTGLTFPNKKGSGGRGNRGGGEASRARRHRLKANPYTPELQSLFLANARTLTDKMDEIRMRTTASASQRRSTPRELRNKPELCGVPGAAALREGGCGCRSHTGAYGCFWVCPHVFDWGTDCCIRRLLQQHLSQPPVSAGGNSHVETKE
ncbi:unnamed protein product [Pleuronectes platessa]|uniref:Uncharacterized protein n=1 Tax=Pleuronectes platessa TaxID=8262 RepID=A0A9N7VP03_PLEPL|nr:unnamed protein product [Pleuronectes platessa]